MPYLTRTFLAVFVLSALLSGCKGLGVGCPGLEPLDDAANYRWLINGGHYSEPLNAWTRHETLEALLSKTYREGGLDALRSRYGFDCKPREIAPACASCFVCRRTIPKTKDPAELDAHACQVGEMTIQADIGPDWTMTVMTYWDRLPVGASAPDLPPGVHRRPR